MPAHHGVHDFTCFDISSNDLGEIFIAGSKDELVQVYRLHIREERTVLMKRKRKEIPRQMKRGWPICSVRGNRLAIAYNAKSKCVN